MKTRSNKLYNYLVNTFGLSREMVLEYVQHRIDELLRKHISDKLNSFEVRQIIADQVGKVISQGFQDGRFSRTDFESTARQILAQEIESRLKEEYTLDVKMTRASNGTIRTIGKGNPTDLK